MTLASLGRRLGGASGLHCWGQAAAALLWSLESRRAHVGGRLGPWVASPAAAGTGELKLAAALVELVEQPSRRHLHPRLALALRLLRQQPVAQQLRRGSPPQWRRPRWRAGGDGSAFASSSGGGVVGSIGGALLYSVGGAVLPGGKALSRGALLSLTLDRGRQPFGPSRAGPPRTHATTAATALGEDGVGCSEVGCSGAGCGEGG